jgi:hypothetical protein
VAVAGRVTAGAGSAGLRSHPSDVIDEPGVTICGACVEVCLAIMKDRMNTEQG